jgi:hypothetical protein
MRANRSLSLPLTVLATGMVWYTFGWLMQQVPTARLAPDGSYATESRAQGLANQFATAVVKFFDNAPAREVPADGPVPVPIDKLPPPAASLPVGDRAVLVEALPELYGPRPVPASDIVRSDVDLDGDGDRDALILTRLENDIAFGAVLVREGPEDFRPAGRFSCYLKTARDLSRCFQIFRTGGGAMHLVSEQRTKEAPGETWIHVYRLVDGKLELPLMLAGETDRETSSGDDGGGAAGGGRLQPMENTSQDLLVYEQVERDCQVYRFDELSCCYDREHEVEKAGCVVKETER